MDYVAYLVVGKNRKKYHYFGAAQAAAEELTRQKVPYTLVMCLELLRHEVEEFPEAEWQNSMLVPKENHEDPSRH
jgi:hypothetical protein